MEIAWRRQLSTCLSPCRDDDCTKGALGNKRRQVDPDIVNVMVNGHPWAIAWVVEEAERFGERGLGVGRVRCSDAIDDIRLDAFPRATVYEENELESGHPLDLP